MRFRQGCSGWPLAAVAFGADRLTKALVLADPGPHELIPGVLRCRLARNTGAAFSMFSGKPWLLCAVTGLMLAALTAYLLFRSDDPPLSRAGYWMIVGGGVSNLLDRLMWGSVVDFLSVEFTRFAIFNVADIFVVVGAALAALGMLTAKKGGRAHGEV